MKNPGNLLKPHLHNINTIKTCTYFTAPLYKYVSKIIKKNDYCFLNIKDLNITQVYNNITTTNLKLCTCIFE